MLGTNGWNSWFSHGKRSQDDPLKNLDVDFSTARSPFFQKKKTNGHRSVMRKAIQRASTCSMNPWSLAKSLRFWWFSDWNKVSRLWSAWRSRWCWPPYTEHMPCPEWNKCWSPPGRHPLHRSAMVSYRWSLPFKLVSACGEETLQEGHQQGGERNELGGQQWCNVPIQTADGLNPIQPFNARICSLCSVHPPSCSAKFMIQHWAADQKRDRMKVDDMSTLPSLILTNFWAGNWIVGISDLTLTVPDPYAPCMEYLHLFRPKWR